MTTGTFSSSAPEFSWTGSACTASSNGNCVSEQVVDTSQAGDGQGIVLAAYSSKTQSCWYAVDLESTPSAFTDTAPGVSFWSSAHVQSGATTAGVFYAHVSGTNAAAHCSGSYASSTANPFAWGQSYASPGAGG